MIDGTVTVDREIVIPLELVADDQSVISIQVVVDTGFNGHISLPVYVLHALRASPAGTRRAELGDGNVVELDVYVVTVRWHDKEREVVALHAEAIPLIGMSLLWGSHVGFDARDGGAVSIQARP